LRCADVTPPPSHGRSGIVLFYSVFYAEVSRKVHFKRNCVTLVVHTIFGSIWRNQVPLGSLSYCSCHLSSAFFRSRIFLSAYCRSHFAPSTSTCCSSHGGCGDPQSVVEDLGHRAPAAAGYSVWGSTSSVVRSAAFFHISKNPTPAVLASSSSPHY
jgi:hypothetical protein